MSSWVALFGSEEVAVDERPSGSAQLAQPLSASFRSGFLTLYLPQMPLILTQLPKTRL